MPEMSNAQRQQGTVIATNPYRSADHHFTPVGEAFIVSPLVDFTPKPNQPSISTNQATSNKNFAGEIIFAKSESVTYSQEGQRLLVTCDEVNSQADIDKLVNAAQILGMKQVQLESIPVKLQDYAQQKLVEEGIAHSNLAKEVMQKNQDNQEVNGPQLGA